MKPLLIHTSHFPPRHFRAITLFPLVLYKGEPMTDRDVRHETVHFYQQLALLILPFYLLYLLFWLLALVRYRNWEQAYRAIPFERSAYRLESVRDKSPLAQAFDWLRCLTDKTK